MKLLLLLATTPVLVWSVLHPQLLLNEISRTPQYTKSHFSNLGAENGEKINEARAAGGSRIFYNKSKIITDELFAYAHYFSPRLYFQAGDGTNASPKTTEPIAGIMFIFFIFGVIELIKQRQIKVFAALLFVAFVAYLVGQVKFPLILPVAIIYACIAYGDLLKKAQNQTAIFFAALAINLFLVIRMLIL